MACEDITEVDLQPQEADFILLTTNDLVFSTTHFQSDGSTPLDLSTHDYAMQLKVNKSDAIAAFELSKTNSRIVLSGANNNILTYTITSTLIGSTPLLGKYFYDAVLTPVSGPQEAILRGTINIIQGVTS